MRDYLKAFWFGSFLASATMITQANAAVVYVTKDCPAGGTCTVSGGGSTVLGRFRVIGQPISWEANYTGSATQAKRFWVSQSGMNMATLQLTTNSGDLAGTASLSNGLWFISAQTFQMGPGGYSVFGANVLGDPHITTLDGRHYDFQGAGEFVLLKNPAAGIEVQSRMTPVSTATALPPDPHTGLSSCPSINTAAALRSPAHRVTYQPAPTGRPGNAGMQLRVDGVLTAMGAKGKTLSDGTKISRDPTTGELSVELRNQWAVRIVPHWWSAQRLWYLDFDFTPATKAYGIAGAIVADSWLPALADGTSLGAKPPNLTDRYKALYKTFADSWRVDASTSLFDYSPGTSTDTYTNTSWPTEDGRCSLPNTVPMKGAKADVAEDICKDLIIPHFRKACVQDVMATGDPVFAKGYQLTQGPRRFTVKVRETAPGHR